MFMRRGETNRNAPDKKTPPSAPADAETEGPKRTRQLQPPVAGRNLVAFQEWVEAHNLMIPPSCTLLELVHRVNSYTASDVETVAVVTYLVNSGRVRLCGTFAGAKMSFS